MVGTDTAKAAIFARLKIDEPGPGYMHFPLEYDDEYFRQLNSESVKTKIYKNRALREWVLKSGYRNEALDINVYNWAALKYLETFKNFNLEKICDQLIDFRRAQEAKKKGEATPNKKTQQKARRRVLSKGIGGSGSGFVNRWRN
jgi:phage terminase large subunit GpA-like protein